MIWKLIPPEYRFAVRMVGYLAVLLALLAVYLWIWNRGADHVQAEWDKAISISQLATANRNAAQSNGTLKVVTEYVDRVQVIREKGDTIIKEVPVYVPVSSPAMPGGFRLLHDASVTGTVPDPARIADARPVPAQDVTATIIGNYTVCEATRQQLISLQDWVEAQEAISEAYK